MIKDGYGRPITSMRISITPSCNFNCVYCHKEGNGHSSRVEMEPGEIKRMVEVGVKFGVTKVKLTGGEPLMRKDVEEIVAEIATVPGITDISMTSNGYYLNGRAYDLKETGLDRVNISLDTLRPETFSWITRDGEIEKVFEGIDNAIDADLSPVKLNMVVMKGVNEDEILTMLKRYSKKGVVLQLIELMVADPDFFDRYYFKLDDVEKGFAKEASSFRERRYMQGRRQYRLNGSRVEVVRPMHNTDFCANCTRIRVTSDGNLKPCLMRSENLLDFLTPLREGAPDKVLEEIFQNTVRVREPYFKRG